jgi:hypothetical protein
VPCGGREGINLVPYVVSRERTPPPGFGKYLIPLLGHEPAVGASVKARGQYEIMKYLFWVVCKRKLYQWEQICRR